MNNFAIVIVDHDTFPHNMQVIGFETHEAAHTHWREHSRTILPPGANKTAALVPINSPIHD